MIAARSPEDASMRKKYYLLIAGVILTVLQAWHAGWAPPAYTGISTVAGSVIYWLAYAALTFVLLAVLLTALLYVARGVARSVSRLQR
jgi:hypothetical protein